MSINTTIGRNYDYFKNLIVPNNSYFVVRLDGNCFSGLTEKNFTFPFDNRFYSGMKQGIYHLMQEIPDIFKAHTHSDEVSLYFRKESSWFNRRVEKITSITASIMAVAFSKYFDGIYAHFDSRVLVTPTMEDIEQYEEDRQLNAFRGCVNSYSFYKLAERKGRTFATEYLKSMNSSNRQELLFKAFNINIAHVPAWQRVGAFFEREEFEHDGYDPIKKIAVKSTRRRIKVIE